MAKGCACCLQYRRQRHPFQRPGSTRSLLLVYQCLVDDPDMPALYRASATSISASTGLDL